MLASRASYDKNTLARQVIPLAPGYRTALLSHPDLLFEARPRNVKLNLSFISSPLRTVASVVFLI